MRVCIFQSTPNGKLLITDANIERPLAGVWWCRADVLVAVRDPFAKSSGGPRIDSDLSHADVWRQVAKHFDRPPSCEYFDTPRGRVQLDRRENVGVVLGGGATSVAQVEAIADVFGLSSWRVECDDHYATGEAADALFDET